MFRFRVATESATCPLTGWAMQNHGTSLMLELVLSLSAKESTAKKGAAAGSYGP